MGKWTATVTNKGYALQAKLLSTDKLNITRVVSGSGSCAVTQLINQTAVSGIKQELTVDSLSYDKYGNARLKVVLNNIGLTTGYDVRQIGIYATDPDEGEILYAITQADEAEPVPSISEQPNGFYCSWDFTLTYSNSENVNVTIDPSDSISREAADLRYVQLSKIGDNLSVDEDGVLSADAQEITVDDKLSTTSTNPVQNKVVNAALSDKVDKVNGKGLSTNDYTTDEKNKLSGIAAGANKTTVDSALSSSSTNPVQNKVVNTALGTKVDKETNKGLSSNDYTTDEKNKLSGIEAGANKYTHPAYTAKSAGLYKVTVDSTGHVSDATGVKKSDITALGIPGSTVIRNGAGTDSVIIGNCGAEAPGNYSTAIGSQAKSTGEISFAKGENSIASGRTSSAEGLKTKAAGNYSHSQGVRTTALGYASHVEGSSEDEASEDYTPTTDNNTILSAWNTKAFALAKGYASHCEGDSCLALGDYSHAEGYQTITSGIYAHAGGVYTDAAAFQHVIGCYSKKYAGRYTAGSIYVGASGTDPATIFYIGCGTSDTARANALRVTADGQARGLKAFLSSGADFAEYMEWEDGNPDNEDRRGRMVAYALTDAECVVEEIEILDPVTHEKKTVEAVVRDKMPTIRYATSFDECIGVVSSSGAFIGNSASEEWNSQYVRDIFGEKIVQAVLIPEETKTYNTTEIDEETGEEVIVEKTEVTPEHWVNQYVLNPHYDPEAKYIEREHRKEWSPVGFHGQIVAVDDGTCVVGGYCSPSTDGIATASETGFRVIQRLDKNHVRLYVE